MPYLKASEQIREVARELGFDGLGCVEVRSLAGTSDGERYLEWIRAGKQGEMAYLARGSGRRLDPACVLPGAQSMICVAMSYGGRELSPHSLNSPRGIIARYARGRDYHKVFTAKLRRLEAAVHEALPQATTRSYVDTGPVLERLWAQRAGLGWRGKHTNLVSRGLGSWFFLGEVLVDRVLPPDEPEKNYCGTCTRCLDACPTQAITGPYQLDARLCISYLTIEHRGAIPEALRSHLGTRIFGCDDCLEVCPWNRFAKLSQEADFHPRSETQLPRLLELAALDQDGFYKRFSGTPVTRAKREGLVRNVCVALGNVGRERYVSPECAAIISALEGALTQDPSALVREHAAWGLAQIESATGASDRGDRPQPDPS